MDESLWVEPNRTRPNKRGRRHGSPVWTRQRPRARRPVTAPALALGLAALALWSGNPTGVALAADAAKAIKIGVLYREGGTGTRVMSGVEEAANIHNATPSRLTVEAEGHPYVNETAGTDELLKLLSDDSIALILGPTDSGVFVNVAQREEYRQRLEGESGGATGLKPIVSPLVTAIEGNKEQDWRFRTNVDVETRTWTAADFLIRAGYRNIGILYRANEFGKRAQDSFKKQLAIPDENYIALPYGNGEELRDQSRKILERRPGAVGVFGHRHELQMVRRNLDALNNGLFSYTPVLFGLVDARHLRLSDTYFLSLMGIDERARSGAPPAVEWDEVRGLAFDTTLLVLDVAKNIPGEPGSPGWAKAFRSRLYNRILGPPRVVPGSKTGMAFSDGKNVANPQVLLRDDTELQMAHAGHSWAEFWKLGDWIEIRQQRFGAAVWFNVALVALISLWLTMADIRRRQDVHTRFLYFRGPVLMLSAFNVLTAIGALVAAAETGLIRWDSIAGALGLAVGHRALLTTTLFETAQGRALGLGRFYERTLSAINKRLMLALYEGQNAAINYIAYTNSLPNMRDLLVNVYSFSQTGRDSQELVAALDTDIARAQGPLRKQEVCARRLLQTMTWKQLQADRIVPEDLEENALVDPNAILRVAVRYAFSGDASRRTMIRDRIEATLHELQEDNPAGFREVKEELDEAVAKAETERGRVYCRLRWLFIQWGFTLSRIRAAGLIPRNETFGVEPATAHGFERARPRLGPPQTVPTAEGDARGMENDHRQWARVDLNAPGLLIMGAADAEEERAVEVTVVNCSGGGAGLTAPTHALDGMPQPWGPTRLRITESASETFESEVVHTYTLGDAECIQIGVAWENPTAELCDRVRRLTR